MRALTALFIALFLTSASTEAQVPVNMELVLAVDSSLSVDEQEFQLQMKGMADTFRDPEVISLIEAQSGGVAVTLFQWSAQTNPRFAIPWQHLRTEASVRAFADMIERLPRDPVLGYTALGRAMRHAIELIASNRFAGERRKIDMSGDGRNNADIPPKTARDMARARDITINGLPILNETEKLDQYFREHVISGPGAFIEPARDYTDYARAFRRKLIRELTIYSSGKSHPIRRAEALP
ncbi:MAG: DUF1194 domain-containing protein [Pseudomonadota bacterium]